MWYDHPLIQRNKLKRAGGRLDEIFKKGRGRQYREVFIN